VKLTPRGAAVLLVAIAALGLVAESFRLSGTRLYPRYDEVAYMALARDFAREGGTVGTIRCYLEGRCREDNRPPLYQFLLAPAADDSPRFFADAKLINAAITLLLLAVVWLAVRRSFGSAVAVGSVVALASMPIMPDFGSRVLHDVLFAAITFATVFVIASAQDRGAALWLGCGALIGLAFLTKGSGHLLWGPLLIASIYHHRAHHRAAIWRRPIVYAAACGFVVVAFFLLWRNYKVWGSPFYNTNGRQVWIDQWRDIWALQISPEWSKVGLGWYLSRHSIWRLLFELARSAGVLVGYFAYTAGVGPSAPVARVVTGAAVVVLAVLGLRRRWRAGGNRTEIVAVVSTIALYFAALCLAARGGPGAQVRYVFPYVVLLLPYAVYEGLARFWPPLRDRLRRAQRLRLPPAAGACAVLAIALFVRLSFAALDVKGNPRANYSVEPRWHETSEWFARALVPGERFALDYQSYYSNWDLPRPDTDARWPFWLGMPASDLSTFMQRSHVRKVLVDTAAAGFGALADKLSPDADAHGPLAFLAWPRCFADSAAPSRFLVYCQP
jgi:4-amino-4-deoxy-L-arabinose transferase-like glycosyltransferase